jgi:hypothetical protein
MSPKVQQTLRVTLRAYVVVFVLAITCQSFLLFLVWGTGQDWVSFSGRFATSPAMAGLFAVLAAYIGARSLNKQLVHTKEKAADESWWQQFEWVTDRIISTGAKDEKDEPRLPLSLAFDLMTSLSKTARAPFQKDAVGGILEHYLRDSQKQQEGSPEEGEAETSEGLNIDAASANSLRNLIAVLPKEASSSASARRVLHAYERGPGYEEAVLKALRHQYATIDSDLEPGFRSDALVAVGPEKLAVEVKLSLRQPSHFEKAARQLASVVEREKASWGVIVTQPPSVQSSRGEGAISALQKWRDAGIHLIEWEPQEPSGALRDRIAAAISNR